MRLFQIAKIGYMGDCMLRKWFALFRRYHGIVLYSVIEMVVVVISFETLSQAFSREQLAIGAAAAGA